MGSGSADGDRRRAGLPSRGLMLAGIVLAAINLRAVMTGTGPLIGEIRDDTGLGSVMAGMIGTVPVLCFGLFSVFAPRVGRRFGVEHALGAAFGLLAFGILIRVAPGNLILFLGTALIGVAIATGNVLLPAAVKRSFPAHVKRLSGLYVAVLSISASTAAAIAIPLSDAGLGWRGSLAVWAAPALVATAVWAILAHRRPDSRPPPPPQIGVRALLRSRLALAVTLFMAAQAFGFYVVLTWLTEVMVEFGLPRTEAGLIFAGSQLLGAVPIVGLSLVAHRVRDDRKIVLAAAAATIGGILILIAFGADGAAIGAPMLGVGQGLSFALALTFFVSRSGDDAVAAELSGTGQSVAYLLAAAGPVLAGAVHNAVGGWVPVLIGVAVVVVVQSIIGLEAGRAGTVSHADLAG